MLDGEQTEARHRMPANATKWKTRTAPGRQSSVFGSQSVISRNSHHNSSSACQLSVRLPPKMAMSHQASARCPPPLALPVRIGERRRAHGRIGRKDPGVRASIQLDVAFTGCVSAGRDPFPGVLPLSPTGATCSSEKSPSIAQDRWMLAHRHLIEPCEDRR